MQTVRAVSPNFANSQVFRLNSPVFFQNQPNVVTATTTAVAVSEQLFNVAPCLIALSQIGVQVNPVLIGVSAPFLAHQTCVLHHRASLVLCMQQA